MMGKEVAALLRNRRPGTGEEDADEEPFHAENKGNAFVQKKSALFMQCSQLIRLQLTALLRIDAICVFTIACSGALNSGSASSISMARSRAR